MARTFYAKDDIIPWNMKDVLNVDVDSNTNDCDFCHQLDITVEMNSRMKHVLHHWNCEFESESEPQLEFKTKFKYLYRLCFPLCKEPFLVSISPQMASNTCAQLRDPEIFDELLPSDKTDCPICGKMMKNRSLLIHLRTHDNHRPYPCRICGKPFTQTGSRKRHEEKVHKNHLVEPALATEGVAI